MAPFPEEVDVFSVPHSRMKELVDVYLRKLPVTDFADQCALKSLLLELQRTFCEFKSHENIENMYIMQKLESKLKALSINNSAVCHCHSDNRLSEILSLVEDGYRCCNSKSQVDCINYGLQLQRALREFTANFLPHMKEEEEVFQPLLMKYFEYEELKTLKEMVIKQHQHWEECLLNEQLEKFCLETKDWDEEGEKYFSRIPPEVTLKIFGFLSPTDLIRCRGVNRQWQDLSYHPSLWRYLDPVQWAKGETLVRNSFEVESSDPEDVLSCKCDKFDTDDNINSESNEGEESFLNNLITMLLPNIGDALHVLILRESQTLSSVQLQSFLNLCPNLTHLDVSYTRISDAAFEGLEYPACQKLTHFDASGCCSFTDSGIINLAMAWRGIYETGKCSYRNCCYMPCRKISFERCASSCRASLRKLSYNRDCKRHYQYPGILDKEGKLKGLLFLRLSGCHHVTDFGLLKLAQMGMVTYLQYLDISGCYLLTGTGLKQMVAQCFKLRPDNLYYCNNITDGPSPAEANGCQNLGSATRFCCSTGQF